MNHSFDPTTITVSEIYLSFWTKKGSEDLLFYRNYFLENSFFYSSDGVFEYDINVTITEKTNDGWFSVGIVVGYESSHEVQYAGVVPTPRWSFGPVVVKEKIEITTTTPLAFDMIYLLGITGVYFKRKYSKFNYSIWNL